MRRSPPQSGGAVSRQIVRLEISTSDGFTKVILIDRSPFLIGSDPSADLCLSLPGVAARHAQIVRLGHAYRLVPVAPAAPLSLNGVPVPAEGADLAHDARLGLGPGFPRALRFLIEGARLEDREDRLIILMEVARTITSSLALDETLGRVLDGAVRFSGAERGYLFLREGERLVRWARAGEAPPPNVDVSLSVAEEVATTGRPIYRDRLGDEPGRSVTESIVRLRLQAILCLPLSLRQDVIGVVYLDSKRPLPHHNPDLPLLEALAGLAAIAIQNSRLVEERLRTERTLVMGQMARAIVHDVRSPLASIRGLADLLRERMAEGDPARSHLSTIIAEVDRLTLLTGDLLQFSNEAPPLHRAPVPIADLVRQTLTPLQPRLRQSNVRLDLQLEEGTRVLADAPRLLRVLHNLVANAMEAMRGGGALAIACQRANGHCLLTVRDTGCGMPEEVRRKVFEPFFSHGKPNGTGLGMAIVRKIVEEHGGKVQVESAPGQGTTVRLALPVAA